MNCPDARERVTWIEVCQRYPDEWVWIATTRCPARTRPHLILEPEEEVPGLAPGATFTVRKPRR